MTSCAMENELYHTRTLVILHDGAISTETHDRDDHSRSRLPSISCSSGSCSSLHAVYSRLVLPHSLLLLRVEQVDDLLDDVGNDNSSIPVYIAVIDGFVLRG